MKRALFYDTETSGMPDWPSRSLAEHQPHIVQIAALLIDLDTRGVVSGFDVTVRPDGWAIDPETVEIHGITEAHASEIGISEKLATTMLLALWERADVRIGHMQAFDERVLRIALLRHIGIDAAAAWKAGASHCTIEMARGLPGAPDARPPNRLAKLHEHLLGRPMENAHSALGDVRATIAVYWQMVDMGAAPAHVRDVVPRTAEQPDPLPAPAAQPATLSRIRNADAPAPCPACGLADCTCRRRA